MDRTGSSRVTVEGEIGKGQREGDRVEWGRGGRRYGGRATGRRRGQWTGNRATRKGKSR